MSDRYVAYIRNHAVQGYWDEVVQQAAQRGYKPLITKAGARWFIRRLKLDHGADITRCVKAYTWSEWKQLDENGRFKMAGMGEMLPAGK